MNAIERPASSEFAAYYLPYIARCEGDDLMAVLKLASERFESMTASLPEAMGDHRYAEGKWSIKEVLQHLIDCERVFAYRALRFARNDATELHGFDEDAYAPAAEADRRSMPDLRSEHAAVRAASIALFGSFTRAMLLRHGTANGNHFSVRALGWAIAGHEQHHLDVINQRYLAHG
ncbi:MAG: DinB family protein [Flavobacteriales bacterium]|jgi:uncharacterized damage-inducible protein DinB|nr:DinB family protein [Flavobacteriales bacterium]